MEDGRMSGGGRIRERVVCRGMMLTMSERAHLYSS